jgi:hypothetical protein
MILKKLVLPFWQREVHGRRYLEDYLHWVDIAGMPK